MWMMRSLNSIRHSVPNLVVAQRVLKKMTAAASQYIADETGEAMIGLMVAGERTNGVATLYILDTISPDDRDTVRQLHTFQQGDEHQEDIFWWLQDNWQAYREQQRKNPTQPLQAKWDVPLRYLGDWHKQPGFMIQPSMGDQMTALDWLDDEENNMEFLVAPIVTLGHPSLTVNTPTSANFLTVPYANGSHMRVDFWYIHRDVRLFQPIIPAVYPDDQLPVLPDYPWHLVKQQRSSEENNRLQDEQLFTTVVLWDVDEKPPLEICFMVGRVGSDRVLILCTPWNYPDAPPSARVAPFTSIDSDEDMYDVFADLWAQSAPVDDPDGWEWSADKYLIDYVLALETALGIKPVVMVTSEEPAEAITETPGTTETELSPTEEPVSSEDEA